MARLADIRSKMTPEVPQQFPHGQPLHDHRGTNYLFGLDPFEGVALLSFRSPGFGWLSFSLEEVEIERLYNALQEQKTVRQRRVAIRSINRRCSARRRRTNQIDLRTHGMIHSYPVRGIFHATLTKASDHPTG
jgi:hypothetical protein